MFDLSRSTAACRIFKDPNQRAASRCCYDGDEATRLVVVCSGMFALKSREDDGGGDVNPSSTKTLVCSVVVVCMVAFFSQALCD